MKNLIPILLLTGTLFLVACGDEEANRSHREQDMLTQIAHDYPLIIESYLTADNGFAISVNSRRVPVIPRSWSGEWMQTYRELGNENDTLLLFQARVKGDTLDFRKQEYRRLEAQGQELTDRLLLRTTPILCGVKSVSALADNNHGQWEDISANVHIRLRLNTEDSRVEKHRTGIEHITCELPEYLVLLTLLRHTALKELNQIDLEDIQPKIIFLVPIEQCRKFHKIKFELRLVDGKTLSFEHAMPDADLLKEPGLKSFKRQYLDTDPHGSLIF